jgi:predicted TIM-barrel fold metal-dependent hydrolase
MRAHGKKKVLFGSNFPMITPAECLAELDALALSDETKALFLGGNAQRVFGL